MLSQPWATCGRVAAIHSTVLRARGGVWHKKDREVGHVPHTDMDTEAHWTQSGWRGWVYGWKLHLVPTVATVWIALVADLTPANVVDNEHAIWLLPEEPAEARYLLGDQYYHAPSPHTAYAANQQSVIAYRKGLYPHVDAGAAVRKLFQQLRSHAIENFNNQFKVIFDTHGPVPTKGLVNTRRFALFSSINFLYGTALSTVLTCVSAATPFSKLLEHL